MMKLAWVMEITSFVIIIHRPDPPRMLPDTFMLAEFSHTSVNLYGLWSVICLTHISPMSSLPFSFWSIRRILFSSSQSSLHQSSIFICSPCHLAWIKHSFAYYTSIWTIFYLWILLIVKHRKSRSERLNEPAMKAKSKEKQKRWTKTVERITFTELINTHLNYEYVHKK